MMRVAVMGMGYVGVTTAATLAYIGHEVRGYDIDRGKLECLSSGRAPFHEPHLDKLLTLAGPRLTFTADPGWALSDADVALICVGTPPGRDGAPDMGQMEAVVSALTGVLDGRYVVVVNKSTVPVGSGNWCLDLIRWHRPGARASVISNPEFLREGSAVTDSLYPDRIVLGGEDEQALELMEFLYQPILDQSFVPPPFLPRPDGFAAVPLVVTDTVSAELIKYAANAFLAMKISFINEIAGFCELVGADVSRVARGIGLDHRIGEAFLRAGIGWGGSCFGKDVRALLATAADYDYPMEVMEAALAVNARQRQRWAVRKLQEHLHVLKGRTVALLGLAFKPHTDDLRDAPALDVARVLRARGVRVRGHDPVALSRARKEWADEGIDFCDTVEEALAGADAAVICTEWPEYAEADWGRLGHLMRQPLIVDGRNCLASTDMPAGCTYLGVGGLLRHPMTAVQAGLAEVAVMRD